ncbi:MAG: hypothetical protein GY760_26510 [Deltaproteobacteria bacterium]|nr:hypothetical protein [Deltaproteobacteria bacterium]
MGDIQLKRELRKEKLEINLINNLKTERLKKYFGDKYDEKKVYKAIEISVKEIESKIKSGEDAKKAMEKATKIKTAFDAVNTALTGLDAATLGLSDVNVKRFEKVKGLSTVYAKVGFVLDIPNDMVNKERTVYKAIIVKCLTEAISLGISFSISLALQRIGAPKAIGTAVGDTIASAVKGPIENYISHIYNKFAGTYVADNSFSEETKDLYKKLAQLDKDSDKDVVEIKKINKELGLRSKFEGDFEKKTKKKLLMIYGEDIIDYIKEDYFKCYYINKLSDEELINDEKNMSNKPFDGYDAVNYALVKSNPVSSLIADTMLYIEEKEFEGTNDRVLYQEFEKIDKELSDLIKNKNNLSKKDRKSQILEKKKRFSIINTEKNKREKEVREKINKNLMGLNSTNERKERIKKNKAKLIKIKEKNKQELKFLENNSNIIDTDRERKIKAKKRAIKDIDLYLNNKIHISKLRYLVHDDKIIDQLNHDDSFNDHSNNKYLARKEVLRLIKEGGISYSKDQKDNESFEEFVIRIADDRRPRLLKRQNNRFKRQKRRVKREKKVDEISKHTFYKGSGLEQLSKNQLMHKPKHIIDKYYKEMQAEKKFKHLNRHDYKKLDTSTIAYELERMHGDIKTLLTHTQGHINDQKIHDYEAKFEGTKEVFKAINITDRRLDMS